MERKGGGRGAGALKDPLVGTTAHIPYGGGLEVSTITAAHTRNRGFVWLKYPNIPKI